MKAFQWSVGLEPDGDIGPETRGALTAARHRRDRCAGLDVVDEDAVRRFQEAIGIHADGVVGPVTREAMRAVRDQGGRPGRHQDDVTRRCL